MRRCLPWLPIAVALATLTVGAIQAAARDPTDGAARWVPLLPALIVVFGPIPYLVPMLLLEWAKRVRLRNGAPPAVGRGATLAALPAIVVAALWPLGIGIACLLRCTPVARALLVDFRVEGAAVWLLSVVFSASLVGAAAAGWIWRARPVAAVGDGPYR